MALPAAAAVLLSAILSADTLTAPPTLPNESAEPRTVEVTLTAAPARIEMILIKRFLLSGLGC